MRRSDRYDTSGLEEAQFEPGSRGRVLKNLLAIKRKREMDRAEAAAQLDVLLTLVSDLDKTHRFTAADVRAMHRLWLGSIYSWAGEYRRVNLSKGRFPFATAEHIPRLMDDFEKGPLRVYTPCTFEDLEEVIRGLAVVHTELLVIHPFRDGNGRVARMLSTLMAMQADYPPLDYGSIRGRQRQEYFAAVQAGLDKNYGPMERMFWDVLKRTLRNGGRLSGV